MPQMRLHAGSGHARVRISGVEHWLGRFGSPEAQTAYDRLIAEYLSNGRQVVAKVEAPRQQAPEAPPSVAQPEQGGALASPVPQPVSVPVTSELTVAELCVMFLEHAKTYYRLSDGRLSSSYHGMLQAVNALRPFGKYPVSAFGPRCLRQVVERLVDGPTRSAKPRPRTSVNRVLKRIRGLFKWAASMELVPASSWHGLLTVEPLRRGRTTAPELPPVRAVSDEIVEATLPHLPPVVADLVRFIRYSGCRPGEACGIRPCDIEQTGAVWTWRLATHKTAWREHDRVVMLGPKAQAVLRPYLDRLAKTPERFCFSPQDSEDQRNQKRRQERRSPMTPSQKARRASTNRKRPPRERYEDDTLNRCIRRACEKAGVSRWTPLQLRHAAGTEARKAGGGLDAAQVRLGHKHASITEVYAELSRERAAELALKLG